MEGGRLCLTLSWKTPSRRRSWLLARCCSAAGTPPVVVWPWVGWVGVSVCLWPAEGKGVSCWWRTPPNLAPNAFRDVCLLRLLRGPTHAGVCSVVFTSMCVRAHSPDAAAPQPGQAEGGSLARCAPRAQLACPLQCTSPSRCTTWTVVLCRGETSSTQGEVRLTTTNTRKCATHFRDHSAARAPVGRCLGMAGPRPQPLTPPHSPTHSLTHHT